MTETIPEMIETARKAGLASVADRLDYLYTLPTDDDDEPMNQKSVRHLVSFMIEHPEMSTDVITMDPSGHLDVMWDITQHGQLDAEFRPSGNVWFAYTVDEPDSDIYKTLKEGDTSPNDMLKAIIPLVKNRTQ